MAPLAARPGRGFCAPCRLVGRPASAAWAFSRRLVARPRQSPLPHGRGGGAAVSRSYASIASSAIRTVPRIRFTGSLPTAMSRGDPGPRRWGVP